MLLFIEVSSYEVVVVGEIVGLFSNSIQFCDIFAKSSNEISQYSSDLINSFSYLVIICLGERFEINSPSAFPKSSKITRVIYPKNHPHQTWNYWLITTDQKTLCIESNIF